MKKVLLLLASALIATSAYAQGTVNFSNLVGSLGYPAITDSAGNKVAEGGFAQLYAGTSEAGLAAVGTPVAFKTGASAGYFNGGTVEAPAGSSFFQVKAWIGGSSFEGATGEAGSSAVLTGVTPGDNSASPPTTPGNLTGLEAFSLGTVVVIPEPGTIALAVLGMAAFFVRRRK